MAERWAREFASLVYGGQVGAWIQIECVLMLQRIAFVEKGSYSVLANTVLAV